jgi:NAD(P)-dependent dehydrogenase (short-subunit alcohol dehydrogenase family)
MARRSVEVGLQSLVDQIRNAGGEASGRVLVAALPDTIEDLVADVEANIGPIDCAMFNLGAQIGNRKLSNTTYKAFELGWRMATFAPFRLASALLPKMAERGSGTLLVTGATAGMRGNTGQHSHAAAMSGRRMLCQTLNAEFGPQGIHVAHIVVDGSVNSPDTLGKMLGENWEWYRDSKGDDGIVDPAALAETYWHIAQQPKNCWTHELDIRPYSDTPWWNDNPDPKINT